MQGIIQVYKNVAKENVAHNNNLVFTYFILQTINQFSGEQGCTIQMELGLFILTLVRNTLTG